jgi:predicted CoA-binding protein
MYREVTNFLQARAIAITGFSRDPNSFSRILYKAMLDRGFVVYPVNQCLTEIDGIKTYPSMTDVPSDVEAVYILNKEETSLRLAKEAAEKGITSIWIHVKCNTAKAKEIEREYGISMIMGECFFMWAEPVVGFHKFHRFIRTLFGGRKALSPQKN